jgi:dTDP-glucose pyrophosphorylase
MRGIILAGDVSSRLWPVTRGSEQLLQGFAKPMIRYRLSTLVSRVIALSTRSSMAGIHELRPSV